MAPTNTILIEALSSENIEALREFSRPLSTFDKHTLSLHLRDAQKDLEVCETHIAKLIDQRAKLQRTIGRCQSLLAPVDDVPTEILASIFEFCCHENVVHPVVDSPALILSKVCHRWRQVSLSTPKIWSSFSIDFRRWYADDYRLPRIVKAFMDRSRSSPLSIELSDSYLVEHPSEARTLEVLANASSRWFDVRIIGFQRNTLWCKGHASRLARLRLDGSELPNNLFTTAPNLLSLDINYGDEDYIYPPFSQLKALTLRRCYSEKAIPALQTYSGVETLTLDNVGAYASSTISATVDSSSVKTLKVIAHVRGDVEFMYKHLRLPQLCSLSISVERYRDHNLDDWYKKTDIPTVRTFLQSSSTITSLHLEDLPASDTHIAHFLSFLPNLHTLYIRDLGRAIDDAGQRHILNRIITSGFLRRLSLSPDENTPIILPKLADLTLHARLLQFDAQALVDMVSARWNERAKGAGVDSLQSVEVALMGRGEQLKLPSELELLQHLRNEGLRVDVSVLIIMDPDPDDEYILSD
ncbi:hypothetical protein VNI00_013165 [Paramarasmius palmivorus]|uniref:F-box domain-containing protein n=1 Tax=Paramarasmius palmivorus TaxID=297713 RepID=A0AAW0C2M0_9AGAR